MSWGTTAYGTTPWGLGSSALLQILHAHARSETTVRVTLSRAAAMAGSTRTGDALNPRTWTVTRSDTGFVYTVLSVREVGASEPGTVFELLLLQKLGPWGVTHTLASQTLTDANGQAVSSPWTVSFDGAQAAVDTAQASRNAVVDFAKPQINDGENGAIFRVGTSGDYDVESGIPLLRKLFIRRLTTLPGGFFHLTAYGIGLRTKEPMTVPKLASLKNEIQRELAREPEVDSVVASVRLSSSGLLQVSYSARLVSTGTEVRDSFSTPTA